MVLFSVKYLIHYAVWRRDKVASEIEAFENTDSQTYEDLLSFSKISQCTGSPKSGSSTDAKQGDKRRRIKRKAKEKASQKKKVLKALRCCGLPVQEKNGSNYKEKDLNRWMALHEAIEIAIKLVEDLKDRVSSDASAFFDAMEVYDQNYGITMLLDPTNYRLLLLYLVIYLTEDPDVREQCKEKDNANPLLSQMKDPQDFKQLLESVSLKDLAQVAPLFRKYFEVSSHFTEEMKEAFFGPWLAEALAAGTSKYAAKEKWGLLASEKEDSLGSTYDDAPGIVLTGWVNPEFSDSDSEKTNKQQHEQNPCEVEDNTEDSMTIIAGAYIRNDLENVCEFMLRRYFYRHISETNYNSFTCAAIFIKASGTVEKLKKGKGSFFDDATTVQRRTSTTINFLEKSMNFESQRLLDLSLVPRGRAASIEQAVLCLGFKLYMLFQIQYRWYGDAEEDGGSEAASRELFGLSIFAILFTLIFSVQFSLNEFIVNSVSVLINERNKKVKLMILFNMVSNVIIPLLLPYSTAIVLQTAGGSVTDVVLNAMAMYFLIDIDDLLVADIDIEVLENQLVYCYLDILKELGSKDRRGIGLKTLNSHEAVDELLARERSRRTERAASRSRGPSLAIAERGSCSKLFCCTIRRDQMRFSKAIQRQGKISHSLGVEIWILQAISLIALVVAVFSFILYDTGVGPIKALEA